MRISPEDKNRIIKLFKEMETKESFLDLLNFSKKIIYGDKFIPFEIKQLNYYISKDSNKRRNNRKTYTKFLIEKKDGGHRTIHAPVKGLKEIQKALNLIIQSIHEPNQNAIGFVKGKSIVDNASFHVKKNYVFNIDLKDFFPSVEASRVWGRLLIEPFNLGNSNQRKKIANMVKTLCTTKLEVDRMIDGEWRKEKRLVLPQGAPTSPTITNAICDRLDRRLSGLSRRFNLSYTRYADDITFSSDHNSYKNENGEKESIYSAESSFRKELLRIITDQNFHIKESKIRLQKRGYRQEVTGLSVNNKVNVPRKYIKDLGQALYFWEKYGNKKAEEMLIKNPTGTMSWRHKGKGRNGENSNQLIPVKNKSLHKLLKWKKIKKSVNSSPPPSLKIIIEGKLLYLKMVKGPFDSTYLKLKSRFDNLLLLDSEGLKIKSSIPKLKKEQKIDELLEQVNEIFEDGYENTVKKFIN